jgi:predicted Zn-dependent protease
MKMRVRALNESSTDTESGDGSDSQVQLTREAQEQQLHGLYQSALQDLKAEKESNAKETLIQLLTLIRNLPDGQNVIQSDQLRFLACKNLGLIIPGDVTYFLDALQIDASDAGLWIRTGIRAFDDVKDFQLARLCFEAGMTKMIIFLSVSD